MNRRLIGAGIILAIAVAVISFVLKGGLFFDEDSPGTKIILPDITIPPLVEMAPLPMPAQTDYPERLKISSLSIDAMVQYVGVNEKGNMATPNNFKDVGWYQYGAVPGFLGSAVMAGHVDNELGFAGVFKKLSSLEVGDEIGVVTRAGSEIIFIVQAIDLYDYRSTSAGSVFSQNDNAYLKLITCEGAWIPSEKTYNQRLVITAVRLP